MREFFEAGNKAGRQEVRKAGSSGSIAEGGACRRERGGTPSGRFLVLRRSLLAFCLPAFLPSCLPHFIVFRFPLVLLQRHENIVDELLPRHAVYAADDLPFVIRKLVHPHGAIGFHVQGLVLHGDGMAMRTQSLAGEARPLLPNLRFLQPLAQRGFFGEGRKDIADAFEFCGFALRRRA